MVDLTLVSGALKNVGDFLIFSKCKEHLVKQLKPQNIIVIDRWKTNKEKIDEINTTDAIIICGGPGVRYDFFPTTYPFLKYFNQIDIPVIPFGIGWEGKPHYIYENFKFTRGSKLMMEYIHSEIEYSSTRDKITKRILKKNGISNVINTGCPTLFEHDKNLLFNPSEINNVVVSMAQNHYYFNLNTLLLKRLKTSFPDSNIVSVFHRGIEEDQYTSIQEGKRLRKMTLDLKEIGIKYFDLSYNLEKMKELYKQSDLHVGFRVHGHAFSISQGIPSYLIWEDGRGQGMSENLKLKGYRALKLRKYQKYSIKDLRYLFFKLIEIKMMGKSSYVQNYDVIDQVIRDIKSDVKNNFKRFAHLNKRLEVLRNSLDEFIDSIKVTVSNY